MEENDSIYLMVNVDGAPLYNSTNDQFWPILVSFDMFHPFVVALFRGKSKPMPVDHFLEDFLEEYSYLAAEGITYDDKNLTVNIKAFICDAPARCFLKCIKGHTGYNACERCMKENMNSDVMYDAGVEDTAPGAMSNFSTRPILQFTNQHVPTILVSKCNIFPLDYMH